MRVTSEEEFIMLVQKTEQQHDTFTDDDDFTSPTITEEPLTQITERLGHQKARQKNNQKR